METAGLEILKMPALSNTDQTNLSSENGSSARSSATEFLCHINHPEDVGAVVTSFCKVIGNGQIQVENVLEREGLLKIEKEEIDDIKEEENSECMTQDIIVSIRDGNSRSSSEDEDEEEDSKKEITYEKEETEIKDEEKEYSECSSQITKSNVEANLNSSILKVRKV